MRRALVALGLLAACASGPRYDDDVRAYPRVVSGLDVEVPLAPQQRFVYRVDAPEAPCRGELTLQLPPGHAVWAEVQVVMLGDGGVVAAASMRPGVTRVALSFWVDERWLLLWIDARRGAALVGMQLACTPDAPDPTTTVVD